MFRVPSSQHHKASSSGPHFSTNLYNQDQEKKASPVFARTRVFILLMGSALSLIYVLLNIFANNIDRLGAGFYWQCLIFTFTLLAFAGRKRAEFPVLVVFIGIAATNACVPITTVLTGPRVLLIISFLLLWTGFLVPLKWNILIAAYATISIFVYRFSWAMPWAITDDVHVSASHLPFSILGPLLLMAMVHAHERQTFAFFASGVKDLKTQREILREQLALKIDQLQVSHEQLIEAQRFKTVGTMASGLAHELNNILTPIRGLAELIAEGVSPEQSNRYSLRIRDASIAASQITSALLTYTRQGCYSPVRTNLRQLLQGHILPMLAKTLGENIQIKAELDRNILIPIDRLLFQQSITNLIFNAADAMPEGGEITIHLHRHSILESQENLTSSLSPQKSGHDESSDYAVITVQDTGQGIAQDHLDQIFDPFFTTKAVGSGSGLGLAQVQGAVTRHGGTISVQSEEGQGTTFRIELPLVPREEEMPPNWPILEDGPSDSIVVVVSEEQDMLDELEEILVHTECSPICTKDPKAAQSMLIDIGDRIDLLILDMDLKSLESNQMFRSLREIFPALPIIVLSDEPSELGIQRMMGIGPTRSLRKPMDPNFLVTLVNDVLHPEAGYVSEFTNAPDPHLMREIRQITEPMRMAHPPDIQE